MKTNLILNTDSYKLSMAEQYPPNTKNVYSYVESRKGGFSLYTIFFGLQAYIKEYLLTPITKEDIDEAEVVITSHGYSFDRSRWEYILDNHDGLMPVEIKALPEGTPVATGTPLVTVVNTDPNCFWLTTYLETSLLRAVWYPSTVATISHRIKKIIREALEETGDVSGLDFKLHDFGARGVSSQESASLGGLAHILNFSGTDTIAALVAARRYYNGGHAEAFSIPAMEHSTVTSWGEGSESSAFRNMLEVYAKEGALLAAVSDSYNIFNAVDNIWGKELKQEVIDSGATVVIRPDSGEPKEVVLYCLESLGKTFGFTVNNKGFKVLNHVRVIQGDGINEYSVREIIDTIVDEGWSVDNVAFGMGGALLQHCDRDWGRWAMKCSAAKINGEWVDVFKNPIHGGKTSLSGRFDDPALQVVYLDGKLFVDDNIQQIRSRTLML